MIHSGLPALPRGDGFVVLQQAPSAVHFLDSASFKIFSNHRASQIYVLPNVNHSSLGPQHVSVAPAMRNCGKYVCVRSSLSSTSSKYDSTYKHSSSVSCSFSSISAFKQQFKNYNHSWSILFCCVHPLADKSCELFNFKFAQAMLVAWHRLVNSD